MKSLPLCALALAVATPVAVPAVAQDATAEAEAQELATARQIIAVMFPPATRDDMFQQLMGDVMQQFAAGTGLNAIPDAGLQAIINEFLEGIPGQLAPLAREHIPVLLEATAEAYASEYSQAELDELLAFANTPTGQHYFSTVTGMMSHPAVADANTRYFAELQQLNVEQQQALRQRIVDYLLEHPEVADSIVRTRETQ